MLQRVNEMMKSMVENGIYSKDEIEFKFTLKDEDNKYRLSINDFIGEGISIGTAIEDLHKTYVNYLKEEDHSQQEILEALSI